jgi:hypothetical protein
MKDRWKFCQCCYFDGHCENQDRGHKCEHYSKQLEDKVERLQEQIKEANEMLKGAKHLTVKDSNGAIMFELVSPEINDYLEKWGVK